MLNESVKRPVAKKSRNERLWTAKQIYLPCGSCTASTSSYTISTEPQPTGPPPRTLCYRPRPLFVIPAGRKLSHEVSDTLIIVRTRSTRLHSPVSATCTRRYFLRHAAELNFGAKRYVDQEARGKANSFGTCVQSQCLAHYNRDRVRKW